MATIYFTSNADSGSGTLRAAIASAENGDTIAPDPTVFTTGPIIIAVSSVLIAANKNLTIDGGELGVVLDGQQENIACVSLTVGSKIVTLVNVTIKRFNRSVNGPIFLNGSGDVLNLHRCKIVDNQNNYFGAIYVLNGTANLHDSLVSGNNSKQNNSIYAGGIRLGADGYLNLVRSTVIFNTIANVYGGTSRQTRTDSFIGFNSYSELGDIEYVNPPEEAFIPFGDWVEGLWQNYDFRLKPTSPYLTGAAFQSGDKDLLGHARTGSWGAYDGSWLVVGESGSETVSADTAVDWLEVASTGVLTLSGADRILTVNRGVFVESGASIASSSRGYVVAPSASDCGAAALTDVVCCVSGAGASNFAATTAGFTWSATDSTKTVVLELQTNGAWQTVAQSAGTSYSAALTEGASVRLFDGVDFLTATVDGEPVEFDFHAWGVYSKTITVETAAPFDVAAQTVASFTVQTGVILMSEFYNAGESPVLFARITDSLTDDPIAPSAVSGISYTCYKKTAAWSSETLSPVSGHEAVEVPNNAVLSAVVPPTDDPRWTKDATGYNFIFEPNSRTNPIFPAPGDYVIVVTIAFTNANPCPVKFEVTVE